MSRITHESSVTDSPFICCHCGAIVTPTDMNRTIRNHCPTCLWSLHADLRTGDRRSSCRGPMEPIAVWARPSNEWSIIHRCTSCGFLRTNRIAADDNELLLYLLAARALSALPFPVDMLTGRTI
ncbi:MAG: RNHCP domain-containing protein [Spirochaetia bacterium]|nr:RNHCP domain-containing protein [Spirochaetia bacterium]MCF7941155.1 RNHCP domain-containing protein [Spirochaetia bacterium]